MSKVPSKAPSKAPPAPPSLQELRKEIDAIDEQVHRLLMARGDIIDRLIQVKQTQEVGSAFRPAREASMMRGLVQRHRGILPLDTIESIWRVIISTFTYVQAPFSVQADGAPKIIARCPFLERADHPAALPVFVISRVADDAMVTEVQMWSVRVSGWNADIARAVAPLAEIVAVPDTAFDGAALLVSDAGTGFAKIKKALIQAGASVRSSALVGSHATRYTVPPNGAAKS
jgi:chorismate mutase